MALDNTDRRPMVTGLFPDRDSAERAYNEVAARGYGRDDVNLVMSDDTRRRYFGDDGATTELGSKAAKGLGVGAGVGGAIGATLAAIAAVGTAVAIPGLGLVVAGPLAAGLAGAGAGGIAGGIIGALIGAGIPEERVKHYEQGIKGGGIVMGVTPRSDDDARYFEDRWTAHSGKHVIGTGVGATGGAATGAAVGSVAGPVGTAAAADDHHRAQQHVDRQRNQRHREPEVDHTAKTRGPDERAERRDVDEPRQRTDDSRLARVLRIAAHQRQQLRIAQRDCRDQGERDGDGAGQCGKTPRPRGGVARAPARRPRTSQDAIRRDKRGEQRVPHDPQARRGLLAAQHDARNERVRDAETVAATTSGVNA